MSSRSTLVLLLILPWALAAGEAPAPLRVEAIAWIEAAATRAPIEDVPWIGGMKVAVVAIDRAAGAMVTALDHSQMRVPLDRIEDRQLIEVLATAGAHGGPEAAEATVLAAAIAWADGDLTRTAALIDASGRVIGDGDERVAAHLRPLGIDPPPGREDRVAALAAERETKRKAADDKVAERKRKALSRVNHAGRTLPPLPPITAPIAFDTPEADAVCAAMQIFPKDNAWNRDVSKLPAHPNSDAIVRRTGAATAVHVDYGFNFIIIPPGQAKLDVPLSFKPESDPGPYPVPAMCPIEGWPAWWQAPVPPLEQFQRTGDGDRHAIIVDPVHGALYEFYQLRLGDAGWQANCAAVWDLNSNKTRPLNWTSADASGMAMFPGIVRYGELASGAVEHAVRMTVAKTRKRFVAPATHWATTLGDDPDLPAMGQRFRLKASYDISKLAPPARAVAKAMQTYGMLIADNGRDWDLCCAIDKRMPNEQLRQLQAITGADLEVVAEDPGSAGALSAALGRARPPPSIGAMPRAAVRELVETPLIALAAVDPAAGAEKRRLMRASPYAFYRAALALQLPELVAHAGCEGPWVWAVGDPHLGNFATLAVGRSRGEDGPAVVFDIADGDDEHPAPWAWDLLRCLASLEVGAARIDAAASRALALVAVDRYREVMARAAEGDAEHGARVYLQDLPPVVADLMSADAEPTVRRRWLAKRVRAGRLRMRDELARDPEARARLLPALAGAFADLAQPPRLLDCCRRLASGVSSLGRRRWLVLAEEPGGAPRLIEIKERRPSELTRVVAALPDHGVPGRACAVSVPLAGDPYGRVLPGAAWPLLSRSRCHARSTLAPADVPAAQRRDLVRLLATLLARFHLRGLELLGVDPAARAGAIADDAGRRRGRLAPLPAKLAGANRAAWRAWRS